jgi:hypothetical protein
MAHDFEFISVGEKLGADALSFGRRNAEEICGYSSLHPRARSM